jgi:hypothetical protein
LAPDGNIVCPATQKASFLRAAAATNRFPANRKTGGVVNAAFDGKKTLKSSLLATIVLIAGSALASSKGSLDLQHPTSIAGKQLASGSYTVRWEGTGDQVELKVYQGKEVVVSTSARVVKTDAPQRYDSAVTVKNGDGSLSLAQIRFAGKSYALEISNDGGGSGSAGAAR